MCPQITVDTNIKGNLNSATRVQRKYKKAKSLPQSHTAQICQSFLLSFLFVRTVRLSSFNLSRQKMLFYFSPCLFSSGAPLVLLWLETYFTSRAAFSILPSKIEFFFLSRYFFLSQTNCFPWFIFIEITLFKQQKFSFLLKHVLRVGKDGNIANVANLSWIFYDLLASE